MIHSFLYEKFAKLFKNQRRKEGHKITIKSFYEIYKGFNELEMDEKAFFWFIKDIHLIRRDFHHLIS